MNIPIQEHNTALVQVPIKQTRLQLLLEHPQISPGSKESSRSNGKFQNDIRPGTASFPGNVKIFNRSKLKIILTNLST